MSDPMTQRPTDLPPEDRPRKSPSPLIWILLLIALIAVGWYFYNRSAGTGGTVDMTAPAPVRDAMTPSPDRSAEKEPVRRPARKPPEKAIPPPTRDAMLLTQPAPAYPPEAIRAGDEGTVMVMADVDVDGNTSNIKISKRSGSRILDRAALREVARWQFEPALQAGKPMASTVQVPVQYTLDKR